MTITQAHALLDFVRSGGLATPEQINWALVLTGDLRRTP